jgi:hypothetical protein
MELGFLIIQSRARGHISSVHKSRFADTVYVVVGDLSLLMEVLTSACLMWLCSLVLLRFMTFVNRCTTHCVGHTETRLRAGRLRSRVSIPGRTKRPLDSRNLRGGSGAHPSSYSVATGCSFLGRKVAGA